MDSKSAMTPIGSALVAGASGFIGSALTRRLSEAGVRVICLMRAGASAPQRPLPTANIEIFEVENFSADVLSAVLHGIEVDVVFNLASYGVRPGQDDPDALLEGNINLVSNLLRTAAELHVPKFIHTGSSAEYGPVAPGKLVSEDALIAPTSLYGAAKASSVMFGSVLARKLSTPFLVLRLFGVYGPGEAPHRLLPYVTDNLAHGRKVTLSKGDQVRDLLYIDDVVEAYLGAAAAAWPESVQIANVCSGIPITVESLVKRVIHVLHASEDLLLWGARPYRDTDEMRLVGDNTRFRSLTGWSPAIGLSEGIRRFVQAYQRASIDDGR